LSAGWEKVGRIEYKKGGTSWYGYARFICYTSSVKSNVSLGNVREIFY